jgi:hypothetical protein
VLNELLSTPAYTAAITSTKFRELVALLLRRLLSIVTELVDVDDPSEDRKPVLHSMSVSPQHIDAQSFAKSLAIVLEAYDGDLHEEFADLTEKLVQVLVKFRQNASRRAPERRLGVLRRFLRSEPAPLGKALSCNGPIFGVSKNKPNAPPFPRKRAMHPKLDAGRFESVSKLH